jgi:hypothetical protein
METQVRTPQAVFNQPQRLIVPLFQRPYVWNEDDQWEPLWSDVVRTAQEVLAEPGGLHHPHFLGAVVLQQVQNPVGTMQERTIIDGQQRLTTLQILLDALHAELFLAGAVLPAKRVEALVMNDPAFWERPEDRFKVWPTNRDRPAFNVVMSEEPPLAYETLEHRDSRLVRAHAYFAGQAREWLAADEENVPARAAAIERAVRDLLQIVVIDLTAEENAQEIFETLNGRGAQLTAADLIKNFVFQRLSESGVDVEAAYERHWKEFETGFWEAEVRAGRLRHQRSAMFLNQWLIAKTGKEILAREVFHRFKTYADFECGASMIELLGQLHKAGQAYRKFVSAASQLTGPDDQLGLFAYRTGVMESEAVKPLVLFLLDPDEEAIPAGQLAKALAVVESWLVRRMLVRASTKSYTPVFAELITYIRKSGRRLAGDVIEDRLQHQPGSNWYWPDNDEIRAELTGLAAYRRLTRARLRMVLEAIEDYERGWRGPATGLGGERIARGTFAIEHIMPQQWGDHWPLAEGQAGAERDALIHTIGNLTLINGRLNSKVSNGPWSGPGGKRAGLDAHDVFIINRQLLARPDKTWDDDRIRNRTERLVDVIISVWPVPEGHSSQVQPVERRPKRRVELADVVAAGLLEEGATLYGRRGRHADVTATVLPDGALDVRGVRYRTPSGAWRAVSGISANGWQCWLIDPLSKRSLQDLWQEYVDQRDLDATNEDSADDIELEDEA